MSGFQVQDPATGEWHDVGAVREFTVAADDDGFDDVPEMPTRMQWSTEFTFGVEDGRRLRDLLEQIAREQRWAARMWIRFPYRRSTLPLPGCFRRAS